MLLMVEKDIRGDICHAIHQYAKANKKYMIHYDKNKESSYLKYWDVSNLYVWVMSQKSTVNEFEWIEDTSLFNKDFIKNYNQVDIQYPEKLHEQHNELSFLQEKMKI